MQVQCKDVQRRCVCTSKSWPAGTSSEQQLKSTGFGMPAVKIGFLPRAVGICPGDEVMRSNIQRELGAESLHFLSIDRSRARRFRHLISMHPDQQPLQGVLGTSIWTEGPWVRSGLAGGIYKSGLAWERLRVPWKALERGGGGSEYSAATWFWIREQDVVFVVSAAMPCWDCSFFRGSATSSSVLHKFLVHRGSNVKKMYRLLECQENNLTVQEC